MQQFRPDSIHVTTFAAASICLFWTFDCYYCLFVFTRYLISFYLFFFATNVKQLIFERAISERCPTQFMYVYLSFIALSKSPIQFFYMAPPLFSLFSGLALYSVWPVLFDYIYLMKAQFKIYNAFIKGFLLSLSSTQRWTLRAGWLTWFTSTEVKPHTAARPNRPRGCSWGIRVTDCLLPAHYSLLYCLATVYCNEISKWKILEI